MAKWVVDCERQRVRTEKGGSLFVDGEKKKDQLRSQGRECAREPPCIQRARRIRDLTSGIGRHRDQASTCRVKVRWGRGFQSSLVDEDHALVFSRGDVVHLTEYRRRRTTRLRLVAKTIWVPGLAARGTKDPVGKLIRHNDLILSQGGIGWPGGWVQAGGDEFGTAKSPPLTLLAGPPPPFRAQHTARQGSEAGFPLQAFRGYAKL